MLLLVALFSIATLAEAEIFFKYSTIYDENDLNANQEIPLRSCTNGGCSVYVSVPKWNVESTRNIYVYSKTGTNTSLYSFAAENDVITWAKTGLHLSNTEYSIKNYNKNSVGPIVIYVVGSQTKYYGDEQVEIYDAANINMRPAKNKKMTMIMSAEPFNIYVQAYGDNLNAVVRTTGFDNNYQRESDDDCRIIYEQNEGKPFRLRINSPIVTINFDGKFNYQICAKIDDNNSAALDYPGVATSQGYIGCSSSNFQVYRSTLYKAPTFTLSDDNGNERSTDLTYVANTQKEVKVVFTTPSDTFVATGNGKNPETKTAVKANKIAIDMPNSYGSSYWVGYKPNAVGSTSIPSAQGICTDWTATTTTVGGVSTTAATQPSTTSAANELFLSLFTSLVLFFATRNF